MENQPLVLSEILDRPLSDDYFNLSERPLHCFSRNEIHTLRDLVSYENKNDLLKLRNFGKKSLVELDELLLRLGLSWGMKFEDGKSDVEACITFEKDIYVEQKENLKSWVKVFESLSRLSKELPQKNNWRSLRIVQNETLLGNLTSKEIEEEGPDLSDGMYVDDHGDIFFMVSCGEVCEGYYEMDFYFRDNSCYIERSCGMNYQGINQFTKKFRELFEKEGVSSIKTLDGKNLELDETSNEAILYSEVSLNDGILILSHWVDMIRSSGMHQEKPKICFDKKS